MLLPTTADHIASIRSTEVAADNTGGAPRLCEKTWLDGGKQDTTFLLVETASGELKGSFSAAPQLDLATITEIQIIADTGPIGFRRVANVTGGTIAWGTVVKLSAAAGVGEIETSVAGDIPAGVALFNIEDKKAAWVATEGVVPALVDAAVTDGDLLTTAASGELTAAGAGDLVVAIAAETRLAAGLAKVRLLPSF
jgi:hypothetical protein